ncbi:hypothetical protein SAMN04515695_4701 [Pseudovibrio sp. Tun.PSC04-5.I4]|nr:hypothetical protein SAMN04515695_4701 [Pseudovibrio sp. Tun.PSC04-5.I4]
MNIEFVFVNINVLLRTRASDTLCAECFGLFVSA